MRPIHHIRHVLSVFFNNDIESYNAHIDIINTIVEQVQKLSGEVSPTEADKSNTFSLLYDLFSFKVKIKNGLLISQAFERFLSQVIDQVKEELELHFSLMEIEVFKKYCLSLLKVGPSKNDKVLISELSDFLKNLNKKVLYQFKKIQREFDELRRQQDQGNFEFLNMNLEEKRSCIPMRKTITQWERQAKYHVRIVELRKDKVFKGVDKYYAEISSGILEHIFCYQDRIVEHIKKMDDRTNIHNRECNGLHIYNDKFYSDLIKKYKALMLYLANEEKIPQEKLIQFLSNSGQDSADHELIFSYVKRYFEVSDAIKEYEMISGEEAQNRPLIPEGYPLWVKQYLHYMYFDEGTIEAIVRAYNDEIQTSLPKFANLSGVKQNDKEASAIVRTSQDTIQSPYFCQPKDTIIVDAANSQRDCPSSA